jgi:hypothetical protein
VEEGEKVKGTIKERDTEEGRWNGKGRTGD